MTAEHRWGKASARPCAEPWCWNLARAGSTKCAEHADPRVAEIAASHQGPRPGPRRVPPPAAADSIEQLLERGTACPVARIRRAAGKAQAAVGALRELLDAYEEAERADAQAARERELAEREVDEARAALERATAKAAGLGVIRKRTVPAGRPPSAVVRRWFLEQGIDVPKTGILADRYFEQFEEAHR